MKILSSEEIKIVDKKTISYSKISSLELMEKAAISFVNHLKKKSFTKSVNFIVVCGKGNNGGDGLVIARLLHHLGYDVKIYIVDVLKRVSEEFTNNLQKAKATNVEINYISHIDENLKFNESIIIDAIFGIGLNRDIEGVAKEIIEKINGSNSLVYSVDLPSGLFLDKPTELAVKATETISFQIPKLALYLPDNNCFAGEVSLVDIGFNTQAIAEAKSNADYLTLEDVSKLLLPVNKFTHKGQQGHTLIIGGSSGRIGAIALAAKGALKGGCGLVTAFIPKCGVVPLHSIFPELMILEDIDEHKITDIKLPFKYNAAAIGMGMGTASATAIAFLKFIKDSNFPLVVDADAINILSQNKKLLAHLPANTIFTPHPGELKRLVGPWNDDFHKIELVQTFAKTYNAVVVIKGANTIIIDSAHMYVNSSGTPALATAGSGDVLSGLIASLLAQNYSATTACKLGVFLHGMTANISKTNYRSFTASDIISNLGAVYNLMERERDKYVL